MTKLFKLPTLYRTTKNTYFWEIEGEKDGDNVFIITSHGVVGGKKSSHRKEVKRAKSKSTKEEQAEFDANSKWKSKRDKEGFSTDKSKKSLIIRPMLAHKFDLNSLKKKSRAVNIVFPAYCQKKFDGIRCLGYIRDGEVVLMSRKGKEFMFLDDIRKSVKKVLTKCFNKTTYLDGELYSDDLPFQEINGLCRLSKDPTEAQFKSMKKLRYFVYDYFDTADLTIPYKIRLANLMKCKKTKYIVMAKAEICKTPEDVKIKHDEYVADGYEGVMLRNMDAPYELNKRSKHLQKYKEFMDDEFKIVGFKEGVGDAKGTVVWICELPDGRKFSVRPKGSVARKKFLFKHGNEYIGKLLTVIFFEYTKDGFPRFPVGKDIRDPKT